MNRTITQKNLYLLLPGKINNTAKIYAQAHGGTVKNAVDLIYKSKMYRQLENESTKFWTLGPVALCEELERELGKS